MSESLLVSLALIIVLGISAQWVAWRIGLPSILLLLLFGFVAGPVAGWVKPDALLGDWLMPLVSVSVGLILFEGGLTLKFRELKVIGRVVRNLISIGALTTWVLAAVAAHLCFGWDWALSTLVGAILTVTGPTVVMPLLRHIKPTRQADQAIPLFLLSESNRLRIVTADESLAPTQGQSIVALAWEDPAGLSSDPERPATSNS